MNLKQMLSNINWKELIKTVALPLLVGAAAGLLTQSSMETFEALNQPPLSPPGILFPIVWTILYTLMGISFYLVKQSGDTESVSNARSLYYYQLLVNFLWPIFFFRFGWYLFSFFWLLLLWALVLAMILCFSKISKTAAYLNIPYLVWLTFAAYLNFGVWWLNR